MHELLLSEKHNLYIFFAFGIKNDLGSVDFVLLLECHLDHCLYKLHETLDKMIDLHIRTSEDSCRVHHRQVLPEEPR